MHIDRKGNRLEDMDVEVNGYRDGQSLAEAAYEYNRGSEIADRWEQLHRTGGTEIRPDWRYDLWWTLYSGMIRNLRRWRKRML